MLLDCLFVLFRFQELKGENLCDLDLSRAFDSRYHIANKFVWSSVRVCANTGPGCLFEFFAVWYSTE